MNGYEIVDVLLDSSGEPLRDSSGDEISGKVVVGSITSRVLLLEQQVSDLISHTVRK